MGWDSTENGDDVPLPTDSVAFFGGGVTTRLSLSLPGQERRRIQAAHGRTAAGLPLEPEGMRVVDSLTPNASEPRHRELGRASARPGGPGGCLSVRWGAR